LEFNVPFQHKYGYIRDENTALAMQALRAIARAVKMTRNNRATLDKVHVAATELPQLLSQNTNMFRETTAQSNKPYIFLNWNISLSSKYHKPMRPLAADK